MSKLTRRTFLGAASSVAALAAMGRPAFAQGAQVRHFWWGNPERDRRTFEVIDIFNGKYPDINVTGETLGFADYFTKLTTQIAGGNSSSGDTIRSAGIHIRSRIVPDQKRRFAAADNFAVQMNAVCFSGYKIKLFTADERNCKKIIAATASCYS